MNLEGVEIKRGKGEGTKQVCSASRQAMQLRRARMWAMKRVFGKLRTNVEKDHAAAEVDVVGQSELHAESTASRVKRHGRILDDLAAPRVRDLGGGKKKRKKKIERD
jgi:hypothetical protein